MSASCSILKKDGVWEFLHLIWMWPKPAGFSMLPLVEEKPTAGGCRVYFLLIFAITSTGSYKYWRALKMIGAATSLNLPPLAPAATTHIYPGQGSFSACKRLMVHPETEHEGRKQRIRPKAAPEGNCTACPKVLMTR